MWKVGCVVCSGVFIGVRRLIMRSAKHNTNHFSIPNRAGGHRVGGIPKIRRLHPKDKEGESEIETNKGWWDDGRGWRMDDFNIRLICPAVFHPFRSSLSSLPFFLPFPFPLFLSYIPPFPLFFPLLISQKKEAAKTWRNGEMRNGGPETSNHRHHFWGDIDRSDTNIDSPRLALSFSIFLSLSSVFSAVCTNSAKYYWRNHFL